MDAQPGEAELYQRLAGRLVSVYPAEVLGWATLPPDGVLEVSPVGAVLKTSTGGELGVTFDMLRRNVNTGHILVAPGFRDKFTAEDGTQEGAPAEPPKR